MFIISHYGRLWRMKLILKKFLFFPNCVHRKKNNPCVLSSKTSFFKNQCDEWIFKNTLSKLDINIFQKIKLLGLYDISWWHTSKWENEMENFLRYPIEHWKVFVSYKDPFILNVNLIFVWCQYHTYHHITSFLSKFTQNLFLKLIFFSGGKKNFCSCCEIVKYKKLPVTAKCKLKGDIHSYDLSVNLARDCHCAECLRKFIGISSNVLLFHI